MVRRPHQVETHLCRLQPGARRLQKPCCARFSDCMVVENQAPPSLTACCVLAPSRCRPACHQSCVFCWIHSLNATDTPVSILHCSRIQVYGKNRGSATAKGRWLARGVETLMWQVRNTEVHKNSKQNRGCQFCSQSTQFLLLHAPAFKPTKASSH